MDAEIKLIQRLGVPAETKQITVNGRRINFLVAGSGKPVVLFHGANIGWGQWYLNVSELAKHFKIYAVDFPGAGKSETINFTKADLERDFVDTAHEFIKYQELKKVSVIGHSLGAWTALRLALRDKELIDKLILVSPVGLSGHMPIRYRLMAFNFFAKLAVSTVMRSTRANMEKFLKSALHADMPISSDLIDYFYESVSISPERHPFFLINRLSSFWRMSSDLVLLNELHKIYHPVLVIGGDKDPIIRINDLQRAIVLFPHACLEIFQNSGHVPPMENYSKFNRRAIDFISK